MTADIQTRFTIASWNETPAQELGADSKIVRAQVTQSYTGELAGNGEVEYLMFYCNKDSATFTGYETIQGEYRGRAGRFVIVHNGVYHNGVASSDWKVVADSGNGELEGIAGTGSFCASHSGEADVTLILTLP